MSAFGMMLFFFWVIFAPAVAIYMSFKYSGENLDTINELRKEISKIRFEVNEWKRLNSL